MLDFERCSAKHGPQALLFGAEVFQPGWLVLRQPSHMSFGLVIRLQ